MSVAIKKALTNLDKSIDKMEANMSKRPIKAGKPSNQTDLFAVAPQAQTANVIGFDRNALARQLDKTIAKVEQLLSEAQ